MSTWSRVCGVAVRSGGDLLVINYCDKRGFYMRFYECEQLGLDVNVQDIRVVQDGTTYKVNYWYKSDVSRSNLTTIYTQTVS